MNKVLIRPIGNLMYQLAIILEDGKVLGYKVTKEDAFLVTFMKRENEDWAECWLRYMGYDNGVGRHRVYQQTQRWS